MNARFANCNSVGLFTVGNKHGLVLLIMETRLKNKGMCFVTEHNERRHLPFVRM